MARQSLNAAPLWEAAVEVPPEAEEAAAALLESLFGAAPSSYTDFETGAVTVSLFLPQPPAPPEVEAIENGLRRIRGLGLAEHRLDLKVRRIKATDWANSWKRHFRPISIGSKLLIRPGWISRKARPGQAVVVLDPGLSFGTGQHPTTSFCLRQLVAFKGRRKGGSLLDIGTGSGILAIAAAKLGYAPIEAFDNDPVSVRVAQENARRNRVAHKLTIRRADLAKLSKRATKRFDVVCANLLDSLLIAHRDPILCRVADGGWLILAGILDRFFSDVERSMNDGGFELRESRLEREWRSGCFVHAR